MPFNITHSLGSDVPTCEWLTGCGLMHFQHTKIYVSSGTD